MVLQCITWYYIQIMGAATRKTQLAQASRKSAEVWESMVSCWMFSLDPGFPFSKKKERQFERFESIWGILRFSVWWKMKVGKVGQVQGLQAPRPKQAQRSQSQTWPTKCQECCRTTKVSLSPVFVDFPDKSWQVYWKYIKVDIYLRTNKK